MSIHVSPPSPPFESFAPHVRAREIISSHAVGGTGRPASPDRLSSAAMPARVPDEALSVRLGHMGMMVAITALDQHTPQPMAFRETAAAPAGLDTLHFRVAGGAVQCLGLFNGDAPDDARLTATEDPVVRRLSRALENAQRSEDEYGGVYADALRLAIVTRLLMARVPSEDISVCEPEPAVPPQTKTGLPKWRFKRVAAYIEEHLDRAVTLADMASAAGLSRMHFASQFRIATGMRPHDYLLRRRIERAQRMLLETGESVVEIALAVGFQTQAHFTTVFRRFVGNTPYRWRCVNRN